eukprot:3776967-Amphidinium_carterae.1
MRDWGSLVSGSAVTKENASDLAFSGPRGNSSRKNPSEDIPRLPSSSEFSPARNSVLVPPVLASTALLV